MKYTVSSKAYLKIFFHVAKHPHTPVNGVLLGSLSSNVVSIVDAVPLLHHWTSLSPMMEIGLDLATQHAASLGLQLVGYYQASERLDDTALAPVGERVASKIKDGFSDAIAFVIDGETIGSGAPALLPYESTGPTPSSWRPSPSDSTPYSLDDPAIPPRAVSLVRESRLHEKFGDFDDHLEDVTIGSSLLPLYSHKHVVARTLLEPFHYAIGVYLNTAC
ncbi:hypothetical protein PC9H_011006 [Pleurotus ostreatus]|uniref:MPN domain-containing protein n=1 Tax=Pleurotus ostreatus TaxID=5322 RepID=A0A8H7DNV6_PLEOS|nr:uncharacterized protein PC9H_011006 [Pleurotus ostreatus]KAF7422847.1 hypothetical protein PC9H_011006 [Pleurotus ostreatus]